MQSQLTAGQFDLTASTQPVRLAKWIDEAIAVARARRTTARVLHELRQRDPQMLRDIGINAAALFASPPRIERLDLAIDQRPAV